MAAENGRHRTNALVSAGACAFVMGASLLSGDPTAPSRRNSETPRRDGRIASYVVSGVGFLGAGVIFKDAGTVRGLNTAATVWCSAAVGVLAGFGSVTFAAILTFAVILTNTALRPIAYRLHPALPASDSAEISYELNLTCRASDETHLRTLLLATISQSMLALKAIHSEDLEGTDRSRIRAEVAARGTKNEILEQIVSRLSLEPGVTALSWTVMHTEME
jgi:putative Mg2+ transporter-C (MgtC) family protein